jgi:hypothetical protein
MWYFIKPKTKLSYRKNHEITEFIKVEYSKESNEHFKKILKLLNETRKNNGGEI